MPEKEQVRLEIGFAGGQIMSTLVTSDSADALERALAESTRETLTLEGVEGPVIVVLGQIGYVKRYPREGQIGFINA